MTTLAQRSQARSGGADLAGGRVHAVRGNIVDVRFPGLPPPRFRALRTGRDREVVLEVEAHVDPRTVRCIALTETRGLARGEPVEDTGDMLRVPVGPELLGRMLDLFGNPLDGREAPAAQASLPIRRAPLPLAARWPATSSSKTG
jgi:F-type H+-transporting ATPase subunit beta